MLTIRQEKILELIVKEYVKDATPVSSKHICENLNCSSATIRNEMSVLEDYGFLEKTHISSGRVPSEKGYRYYVDNLMQPKQMNGEDLLKLQIVFNNKSLEINDCIRKSLEIVSEITNYTSVVLGNKASDNYLKKVEAISISDSQMLAIVVTDKGHVSHKNIAIDKVTPEEIGKMVELINKLLVGALISEINAKLEYEIKPIIGQYVKQYDAVYNAFYDVFNDFTSTNISVSGRHNILKQPEFNTIPKVKKIFDKLDSKEALESIEEDNGNINIYIGKESKLDDDITVIKTKYNTGKEEGTLAIIGPKRMEYERVVNMLFYIKEQLENKE